MLGSVCSTLAKGWGYCLWRQEGGGLVLRSHMESPMDPQFEKLHFINGPGIVPLCEHVHVGFCLGRVFYT